MGDVLADVGDKWFNIDPKNARTPPNTDESAARIAAQRSRRLRLRRAGGGAIVGPLGVEAPELETGGQGRSPVGIPDILSTITGGHF